jgi:hypothetical protein
MPSPDTDEVRPGEQDLHDEALEEVAGGFPDAPVIEIGPPPFFSVIDCT